MTLDELSATLPNGFHDADLKLLHVDYARREVALDLDIWIGDMDEREAPREAYRSATVLIEGLQFISIEPPDPRYLLAKGSLTVDVSDGRADSNIPAVSGVPADCFVSRFFVTEWNAFIHVAARSASLDWRSESYDRTKGKGG